MNLGLAVRRECWTLSRRGKLCILLLAVVLALGIRSEAYSFFAVNHPVDGDVLIVESWVPDYILNQAAAEFKRGHYRNILLLHSDYEITSEYFTRPGYDYKAGVLIKYGVPRDSVITLFFPAFERDRTYHSALAAKEWLAENKILVKALNVVTVGPHARRSWLLYAKAFQNTADTGVIALRDPMYDPGHWWRTSEGVREMLGEAIAYAYARFLFVAN